MQHQPLLKVLQADALASVQDLGRRHGALHGITEGGVADLHAAMWANCLLGRGPGAALIEIAVGMFTVEFQCDSQIAITGADLNASLNGQHCAPWQTFYITAGDSLQFDKPANGMVSYLAIKADLNVDRVFNSVSTVAREKLGGPKGRTLAAGDEISGIASQADYMHRQVPQQYIPDYNQPLELQLISGYQFDQFPSSAIDAIFSQPFQIQTNSNRMAYSVSGSSAIQHRISTLPSEGIAYGAIQIPPDGNPVILLNDRQTIGGYPKLGCISRLSGAALLQRHYPAEVCFKLVSVNQASAEYRAHLQFFKEQYQLQYVQ